MPPMAHRQCERRRTMRCSELLRASRWLLRTAPAACAHPAPAAFPQPARRAPQSLSLGSLGQYYE